MSEDVVDVAKSNGSSQDLEALRADIERTRAELGDTVQALAAKADVKARAREQVEDVKARVRAQAEDAKAVVAVKAHDAKEAVTVKAHEAQDRVRENPVPVAAIAAGVAAAVVLALWLIRRRR